MPPRPPALRVSAFTFTRRGLCVVPHAFVLRQTQRWLARLVPQRRARGPPGGAARGTSNVCVTSERPQAIGGARPIHPCAAIASKQTRRLSRCPRREGRARHRRTRFSPSPVGCMLGPCRAAAPSSQGLARAAATFAQASAARARGGARGPIQAMRRRAHGVKQFARPVLELGVA